MFWWKGFSKISERKNKGKDFAFESSSLEEAMVVFFHEVFSVIDVEDIIKRSTFVKIKKKKLHQ